MAETVSVGNLINRIVRAREWDPETYTLSGSVRDCLADAANEALAKAYAACKWPQLARVELRTYRPPYASAAAYTAGMEVYAADGAYYRALSDNPTEAPSADSAQWQAVTPIPFIELAQPWENTEMDENGVDLSEFAYAVDPRQLPFAKALAGCRFWMSSVVLPQDSPARVYVRFVPKRPRIGLEEWSESAAYDAGSTVYVTATGKCWRAAAATAAGDAPGAAAAWREVRVPEFLVTYLKEYALSMWLTDSEGRTDHIGIAKSILNETVDAAWALSGNNAASPARVRIR